jgi:hypothetical protein
VVCYFIFYFTLFYFKGVNIISGNIDINAEMFLSLLPTISYFNQKIIHNLYSIVIYSPELLVDKDRSTYFFFLQVMKQFVNNVRLFNCYFIIFKFPNARVFFVSTLHPSGFGLSDSDCFYIPFLKYSEKVYSHRRIYFLI